MYISIPKSDDWIYPYIDFVQTVFAREAK